MEFDLKLALFTAVTVISVILTFGLISISV
ncbi:cytochrome bd-I oxidase subunit CydH [Photobacterium atrarenae]